MRERKRKRKRGGEDGVALLDMVPERERVGREGWGGVGCGRGIDGLVGLQHWWWVGGNSNLLVAMSLIAQTMQIPLSYAEDIIGIGGANIAYIRRTSGAILSVQESRGLPDEITVEIKGTSSQVQTAQQLIQEFISSHKEPASSSYGKIDTGLRSSYSQLGNTTAYPSSSLSTQPYGGYGSSGLGGGVDVKNASMEVRPEFEYGYDANVVKGSEFDVVKQ
ncbi:hypothetical protein TEA_014624 [Camellia sinensis var. sinensis]|uniref:K Homology domain-containing protein n=1 Tax=Camellia sinensis var. sinensis TaxID=542762 RepID=A0A4S4E1I5_CAMSN|nr:hypothetical protein TEA_014624 [Camellia sinensis var. sinensis]